LVAGGAVGLSLCDQIHVHSGVLSYDSPGPFDQAWWVLPQFALATAAIYAGARPVARRLAEPAPAALAAATLWFVGVYAVSGVADRWPHVLAAALGLTWAARVAASSNRAALVAYSLLLAAVGTGYEAALSSTGAFEYARQDFVVPIWLPGLYLHGAPLALALTRKLQAPSLEPGVWELPDSAMAELERRRRHRTFDT
jgi:hypothetical protein